MLIEFHDSYPFSNIPFRVKSSSILPSLTHFQNNSLLSSEFNLMRLIKISLSFISYLIKFHCLLIIRIIAISIQNYISTSCFSRIHLAKPSSILLVTMSYFHNFTNYIYCTSGLSV